MLMISPAVKVFLALEPADMRKSFDGLSALVAGVTGQDPYSGHLFVFRGRRGDRVKILYWDRSGYALFYKRLEEGTFRFPAGTAGSIEIESSDLMLLLEGIELEGAHRRKRYARA